MGTIGPWQILLILAIILLLFGAARLPALAKSLGQSARAFKGEMKQMQSEGATTSDSSPQSAASEQSAAPEQSGPTLNGEPARKPGESSQS